MERETEREDISKSIERMKTVQEVARGPWLRISATLVIPWPWGIIKSTRPPEIIMSPVNRAARLQRFELQHAAHEHDETSASTGCTAHRFIRTYGLILRGSPPTAKVACIRHTSIMPADNLKRSRPLLAQLPLLPVLSVCQSTRLPVRLASSDFVRSAFSRLIARMNRIFRVNYNFSFVKVRNTGFRSRFESVSNSLPLSNRNEKEREREMNGKVGKKKGKVIRALQ